MDHSPTKLRESNPAFTIVELLIVIVVIAILAAISIVAYNGVQNRASTASASDLATKVSDAAELVFAANGQYPQDSNHTDWFLTNGGETLPASAFSRMTKSIATPTSANIGAVFLALACDNSGNAVGGRTMWWDTNSNSAKSRTWGNTITHNYFDTSDC